MRPKLPVNNRERLKLEYTRAASLRELYPNLAQVRIEIQFADGTSHEPSPTNFSYFPAARGFFRFACPCHTCSGEIDLSRHVAELAEKPGQRPRSRRLQISCTGLRIPEKFAREACPICADIHVSATPHPTEQTA